MTPKYSGIDAGQYKHRLKISKLKEVLGQDSTGDQVAAEDRYEELFTVWGELQPQQGREFWGGERVNTEMLALAWTRYTEQITDTMILEWVGRNKTFNIISVIDIRGEMRELEMQLKEMPVGQPMRNPE